MTPTRRGVRAQRRIDDPPSMAALAAEALRERILSGELGPGERIVENRVAEELGLSRPPLREALTVLQQEGLVELLPRRGAVVATLTLHDVFEIMTLRSALEREAVRLGVPVTDPSRLAGLERALLTMEENAADGREDEAAADSHRFHAALVALAGHGRIDTAYRSLGHQLRLYLGLNRQARSSGETLTARADRHRALYDAAREGRVDDLLAALADPAQLTFVLEHGEELPGASDVSLAWLAEMRTTGH